jgi:uncharacterized protein with GYD domain
MPKYLFQVSYTIEGTKGLLKEGGTHRRETVAHLVDHLGGTLEAFYYAFGSDDVVVIAEVPDEATAAAVSLAVGASGAAHINTTVLLAPEVIDEASKKSVGYRAPGAPES